MSLVDLFAGAAPTFAGSPLYQALCPAIAHDPELLDLAAQCRPGQRPPNMLFAAVHQSIVEHPDESLAQWYGSIVGINVVRDPATAAPVFANYCRRHKSELTRTMRNRLVQTNVVQRAVALRFGLAQIGTLTTGRIALIEVGCSAGLLLRQDAYCYRAGNQRWGVRNSAVILDVRWRSEAPLPDLDALPKIDQAIGIDLHLIDAAEPSDRAWLDALVWPENRHEAVMLQQALDLIVADPPRRVAGDVRKVLPEIVSKLPIQQPVVVFHAATRAHVPAAERADFDNVIDRIGDRRPLFHLSLEGSRDPRAVDRGSFLLQLEQRSPQTPQTTVPLALVGQHGEWIEPLD